MGSCNGALRRFAWPATDVTDAKTARLPADSERGFKGVRYTVIWYKPYDSRKRFKRRDDPILDAPGLVNEAAL